MMSFSPRAFLAALILIAACAIFFELGRMEVWSDNEGQRAAPPAEMLRSGNYITPTLNGNVYLAKPPLLYWAIAGVYAATGTIDELTARIPTAVCGLIMVVCAYLAFRRSAGEKVARWTALGLLASPYFMERSHWAELDVPLVLATFLAIVGAYTAWRAGGARRRFGLAALAGVALAAATLLKGPVPYLFLGASYVAYCIAESDDPDTAMRWGAVWTGVAFLIAWILWPIRWVRFPVALVFLCVVWMVLVVRYGRPALRRSWAPFLLTLVLGIGLAAPWAAAVLIQNGWGFVEHLLNSEVIERTHTATKINSGSPFYYLMVLPFMAAPLGLLFPLHASPRLWSGGDATYRFTLIAGWLSVSVFSMIAGKEYEYILPILPILLVPTGYHLARWTESGLPDWTETWTWLWERVFLLAAPVAPVGVLIYGLVKLRQPVAWMELTVFAALGIFVVVWKRRDKAAFPPALRIVLATVILVASGLLARSYYFIGDTTPKQLASTCREIMDAGYPIEATKVYPAFTFYAAHPIRQNIDEKDLKGKLRGPAPYFYLTHKFNLPMLSDLEGKGLLHIGKPVTRKGIVLVGNANPAELLKGRK
jgi:4-amino-4-deoxy-L-arabinose transferase-like glycosyltransferase